MNVQSWLGQCARVSMATAALWAALGSAAAVHGQAARPAAPPPQHTPPPPPKPIPPDRVMATVNGQKIVYGQLAPILSHVNPPLPTNLPEKEQRELYREALSMLIEDALEEQFLNKHVPPPSAAAVDKKLAEEAANLKKQNKTLADLYRESKRTEADVRADLATDLRWSAYADKIVKDGDLKKYYADYRDFFDRVTVRASHIVLKVPPSASASELAAARARLLDLRAQIVAGKLDFAEAAKAHSQCPTAAQGGDVGSFPRKFVVDENFARAAFALQPGQVSDVVQTSIGLHLIKVTERKAAGPPSDFNKIKVAVRQYYIGDMRLNILARLLKEAKVQIFLP